MKTIIEPVKGTRDFYPKEMSLRTWLHKVIREVSESFGYQEWDAPFLEKLDLYAAKSGEELVKEQAFVFPDRGGNLITLRPELTPSLARMVAQKQNELIFPLRWWSFGPFWRYERPQKGRTREFFQWNIDLIGGTSPEADAEIVAVGAAFLKKIGLLPSQVKILINNRRLMDTALGELGIPIDARLNVIRLIDKRDKLPLSEWEKYCIEQGLKEKQLDRLNNLMCDQDLWKQSPELQRFFLAIHHTGFSDYVEFNPQVIRGLDYYTGTVFEAREVDRDGRAVLGGGRYDNLVSEVGGKPVPAVGFAMGDVMLSIVLEKHGLLDAAKSNPISVMVAAFDEHHLINTVEITSNLRNAGINVTMYPEAAKLQHQFKYADKMGIRFVLVQGPDEEASNQISIKDLKLGKQSIISVNELINYLLVQLKQENDN